MEVIKQCWLVRRPLTTRRCLREDRPDRPREPVSLKKSEQLKSRMCVSIRLTCININMISYYVGVYSLVLKKETSIISFVQ